MANSNVQDKILSKIKISLKGQKAQVAFCRGGPSKINDELSNPDIQFKESLPAILYRASEDEQSVQRIIMSQMAASTEEIKNQIQRLTDYDQPASFGKGGKKMWLTVRSLRLMPGCRPPMSHHCCEQNAGLHLH